MNIKNLQKLGGISIILGSILLTIYTIATSFLLASTLFVNFAQTVSNPNWTWIACVAFFGLFLMIFGFITVYSKIYSEAGIIGLVGFILMVIAYLLQACKVTWEIFIYPILVKQPQAIFLLQDNILKNSAQFTIFRTCASLTILIGVILFCMTLFRSSLSLKISSSFILIGAIIYGLSPILSQFNHYIGIFGIFIFAIGCFLLGQKLISE